MTTPDKQEIDSTKNDALVGTAVLLTAAFIYWLCAWRTGQTQTPATAYFNELAAAFLHGRLFLDTPAALTDLTLYQGRWYVPFLPLPTFLMLPWVAVFGSINTVSFSILFGALNVCLVFLMMRGLVASGWIRLRYLDSLWLTALFGFGSVHWYMAEVGSVWYVSQICTATFMAMSAWLAVTDRHPLLVGAALGAAIWARPDVILMFPLLAGIGYQRAQAVAPDSRLAFLLRWISLSVTPLIFALAGILLYNWLRFNNLLDFGYLTENVAPALQSDLAHYGQFNLYFAPRNLWTLFLALPHWDSRSMSLIPDGTGMSLMLTSPALLYLAKARQRSAVVLGAWLSVLLILIPLMLYYNTGWYQFGYRFSLDFMVPVMVLLAYASREKMPVPMQALIVLSVAINAWGLSWCCG